MTGKGRVHDLLDLAAARDPDRTALVTAEHVRTYAGLRDDSLRLAGKLDERGVRPGDRVVLLGHNGAATVAAVHALSRLGAAFVVVAPSVRPFHLRHILADCEPVLVLADDDHRHLITETGATVPVHPLALPGPGPVPVVADRTEAHDMAALIYTSGSTALPKAVISTHAQIRFAAGAVQERLGLLAEDVIGCFLPLAFDYGLYQAFLACAGGTTLALGRPSDVGPGLLARLRNWNVTVLPAVPSLVAALLSLGARRAGPLPALRMLTNTGAHLPQTHVTRLRELFPGLRVHLMYGLTECKRVSVLLPEELDDRPGSVGRPLEGTRCLVLDAASRPVPPGTKGELVVQGRHVMSGYWRAPELTAHRFRRYEGERALFTGDLCSMDEDGYLYFHGREDDIYKSRGFRVSALEVEAAALDVPGVEGAALVVPGADRPVLYTVGAPDPSEVMAGLRERLDDHKLPVRVQTVPRLPLTSNGKVDKKTLRESLVPGEPVEAAR
ncbi:class I adenylate-forming enzyme family protein [Streptomyces sp. MBT53]|uniref:class I adenylate-forming enzyme family protein n=1 Tax=Streptomyces sp. MBT53 TaxID=1488384 RepID=UPI0019140674|nr:class I adenylate-forming enzyme family protein [Streptomyces sp. MBT53]MBK6015417.1 acyl--CoA ligase [Streptomyces sp. MBT53]